MVIFHSGELAVQARQGVAEMAARIGRGIDSEVSPPVARFLAEKPLLAAGNPDGIVLLEDAQVLAPDAVRLAPAAWEVGTRVGLLAIDFATRHRVRINGSIAQTGILRPEQVYWNCQKHIQRHDAARFTLVPDMLSTPDAFLIATASPQGGADVSHRGGAPGFITEVEPGVLTWAELPGNTMFNTLGNLEQDPRAALLLLDFAGERAVHRTGLATVDYTGARPQVRFQMARTT